MKEITPPKVETRREILERTTGVSYVGATKIEEPRILLMPRSVAIALGVGVILGAVSSFLTTTGTLVKEKTIEINKLGRNEAGFVVIDPINKASLPLGSVLAEMGAQQVNTFNLLNMVAQQCFAPKTAPSAAEQPSTPPSAE